jgi:hypothetical protein
MVVSYYPLKMILRINNPVFLYYIYIMNYLEKYDKKTIEKNIKFFQKILLQQKQLSNVIEKNANNKIYKTKSYIKELTPIIDQKLALMHNLDKQIRSVVKNNKINLKNDTKYKQFLQSEKCILLSNKINEIDTTIIQLKQFLDKQNIELLPKN